MQPIELLSSKEYQPNTYGFGPIDVPVKTAAAEIQVDLTGLDKLTLVLNAAFELSQDGGETWLSWGGVGLDVPNSGCTMTAQTVKDPKGVPVTYTGLRVNLPNPDNAKRQLRGTVSFDQPFNTKATLILT